MNRKLISLTMAMLLLCAMALNACGKKGTPETTQAATEPAATTQAALEELGLTTWSLSASTWSSPNGATIHLTGRARTSSSAWRTRRWRPLPVPGRTATMWRTLT